MGHVGAFAAEWARLAMSNEIKSDDPKAQLKVDGKIIKKFCSGGDMIKARKLRQDSVPLKLQSRLLMMANDFPECSPSDCLENRVTLVE